MPKNTNKTNFDLASDSLIEKCKTMLVKLKIRTFQLIAKILLKQQSLNLIRQSLTGHVQTDILEMKQWK